MANRKTYPQTKGERELTLALQSVTAALVELKTKYTALLAKLDADAGVTDTNYAATQALTKTVDQVRQ